MTTRLNTRTLTISLTIEEQAVYLRLFERLGFHFKTDPARLAIRDLVRREFPGEYPTLFQPERCRPRQPWPDFDGDVHAWVRGEKTAKSLLREGYSLQALEVRLFQRAQELGLRRSVVRSAERQRVVAAWLKTNDPTVGERRVAEAYVRDPNYTAAGTLAGVSRQRVQQVVYYARGRMKMAERMENPSDFFPPKCVIQPEWLDGEVWKVTRGVDFHTSLLSFTQKARKEAEQRGLKFQTRRDMKDLNVLYMRFVKGEPFVVPQVEQVESHQ